MKCKSGKKAWEWIKAHSERCAQLVLPPRTLTVGELEAACGTGALEAAERYCRSRREFQTEFGTIYPYAVRYMPLIESLRAEGKSDQECDEYIEGYWRPKYGTGGERIVTVTVRGNPLPTDSIKVLYPCIA